jgi:hypothetical protein
MRTLLCIFGLHRWALTDPTGGDPLLGGPVYITVCRRCGREKL